MSGNNDSLASAISRLIAASDGKKPRYRQEFADISIKNTDVVDDLMKIARRLASKKQYTEANHLLRIAQQVLDNNKRLQNKVGEVLSDMN